jgi:SseB protein C-terminal domain/SseB protein N-terminal domain
MFEAENEIERLLVRAASDPFARAAFTRALMDAQIFLVLVPDGPVQQQPDGSVKVPDGTKLNLPSATRGEVKLLPFFTSPLRAHTWFKGEYIVVPDKTRDLFVRYSSALFVLNPASDYGKEFTPDEVRRLLSGHFDDGPATEVIQKQEQVLLSRPADVPTKLIAALGRELGALKSVRAAYLMQAMRESQSNPSWMLGVDNMGNWQDVQAAIGRALAGGELLDRELDAMPLDHSPISINLRTGIPVVAAQSGILN